MLRRLSRLLIVAVLLAVIAFVASKLMGGDDDDFDDFDDLDSGFEFQETPVEIDVPAAEATRPTGNTDRLGDLADSEESTSTEQTSHSADAGSTDDGGRLIDINGIGHAFESRLHAIGINSIRELANADAEAIAAQIDVIGGASTVGDWISQARAQYSNGQ